jgi:hypothetical protein
LWQRPLRETVAHAGQPNSEQHAATPTPNAATAGTPPPAGAPPRRATPPVAVQPAATAAPPPRGGPTTKEPTPPAVSKPANGGLFSGMLDRASYEERIANSTERMKNEPDLAFADLERLAAEQPARPEAYEVMAGIKQKKRAFTEAHALFAKAIDRGGKATFTIMHDHGRDAFAKSTCVGLLTIRAKGVTFDTPEAGDRFTANGQELHDVGTNRMLGSDIGGFHLAVSRGGSNRNFNLAPQSRDKAESTLIIDLLTAYVR